MYLYRTIFCQCVLVFLVGLFCFPRQVFAEVIRFYKPIDGAEDSVPSKRIVPASIIKVATASQALTLFGENHHFYTDFIITSSDDLVIKGFGHPDFTARELNTCLKQLPEKEYRNLILDASYFHLSKKLPGRSNTLNPYDAPNGALSINYNTISLKVSRKGITSGEADTPITKYAKRRAQGLKRGKHRITTARNEGGVLQHFAEITKILLAKNGSRVSGEILFTVTPADSTLLLRCKSEKRLSEILSGMLEYSNNFTANQLFLLAGAVEYGAPATIAKAQRALRGFLREKMNFQDEFRIEEGAGLSRANSMSVNDVVHMLEYFKPYYFLLNRKGILAHKSGTLKGHSNLAGYVLSQDEVIGYFGYFSSKTLSVPDRIKRSLSFISKFR